MKQTAEQIVNKLLEYGAEEYEERPGGKNDPWRQSVGRLMPMEFAPRPPGLASAGEPAPEVLPTEQDDALDVLLEPPLKAQEIPIRRAVPSRFRWRPPTPPGP